MRKIQKFGAAMIVAAVLATTGLASTVHASDSLTVSQKTAICSAIETTEAQLAASSNYFVKKYLSALLAGLENLESYFGGCGS
jgi:hypothetical protein